MSSIGSLEANVTARTEQFERAMGKAGQATTEFRDVLMGSGGLYDAIPKVEKQLDKMGNKGLLSGEILKRSFGQVVGGVALLSSGLGEMGSVGQVASQAFGGFLVGGPIGAGVSLLSNSVLALGKSFVDAHEKAAEAARKHQKAIEDLAQATAAARDTAKESAARLSAIQSGGDGDEVVNAMRRAKREREARQPIEDAGAKLRALNELDALPADQKFTRQINPDQLKQDIRDQEQILRLAIERANELLAGLAAEVGIEAANAEKRVGEAATKAYEDLKKLSDQAAIVEATRLSKADASVYAADQARIAKIAEDQAKADQQAREALASRVASLSEYIAGEERVLGMKAEDVRYADLLARRDEAMSLAQAEQVNRLNEILAAKRAIADATARQEEAEKRVLEAKRALLGAENDVNRAKEALMRTPEKSAAAPSVAPAGPGAAPGETGPSRTLTGGGPGVWFEQQAMGPLAAAREAKRQARQQRKWKNHADNQRAQARESMSYGTIQDGGFDPFAFDLGSVMAQYKPSPKKEPGAQTTTSVLSDRDVAINAMNEASHRQEEAARLLAEATSNVAGKMGEVAGKTKEGADAAGRETEALTELGTNMATWASAQAMNGELIAGLAASAKASADALAAQNAAIQIAGP